MPTLQDLIQQFVEQLSEAIESQARARAREAVERALSVRAFSGQAARNGHVNGSNGNGAAVALRSLNGFGKKPRKKAPIQLCPVPGCTERAAPVFGMVCAKHKDLPKAKIKKYREARRAQKLKVKGGSAVAGKRRVARKAAPKRASAPKKRAAQAKRAAAAASPPAPTPTT